MLALFAALGVAWANGANDNFKGVATLFGTGTSGYRKALAFGTLATFAGSLMAMAAARSLTAAFGGAGLAPAGMAGSPGFVAAVALGAGATVLLATRLGFPVSTTHALTGGLVGASLAMGGAVNLGALGARFFLPLALSPLLAGALVAGLYPLLRWARRRLDVGPGSEMSVAGGWVPASRGPVVSLARIRLWAVNAQQALDGAHYLSAGAVSFARGLNDTPKLVAMLLGAQVLGFRWGVVAVACAMAAGAVVQGRRVAEKMSHGITAMNHGQGFTANGVTAALVLAASLFGLPVSTTHVSCGALFGLGAVTRQGRWSSVRGIALAWVVTLPLAAALAALAALIAR